MEKRRNPMIELVKILAAVPAVLLPVALIWAYIALYPMNYTDGEAPYYFWNRDTSRTPSEKEYRTLILGDSAANAAYLPEVLSENAINLSLGGTTPAENYYVLKDWLSAHPAPEAVYISFMDYHLIYDNMFYERTVYSHRLTPEAEREILAAARECEDENIAVSDGEEKLCEYDIFYPKLYLPALLNAGFSQRRAQNEENYNAIGMHRGAYIGLTADIYADTDPNIYDSYPVNPLYDRYYRKILDLCRENGIRVRIVSLPKTGNSVLADSFRNKRDGYYEDLAEAYDNVSYFNLIDTMENRCFLDWEHFNIYGAWAFSERMRSLYPADFRSDPLSNETVIGQLAYLRLMKEPDLLLRSISGEEFSAVLISADAALAEKGGARDSGAMMGGKHIWLRSDVIENAQYNESDGRADSISVVTNEDGTVALRLKDQWYPIAADETAGATLILISHRDNNVVEVRNYLANGTGYLLK